MKLDDNCSEVDFSYERIKTELTVYYGPSEETILTGFSVDISPGGLYLRTNFPLNKNQILKLIFTLPDHEEQKPILCKARIAWVNSKDAPVKPETAPGVGLEFEDISSEDLESIINLIEIHPAS